MELNSEDKPMSMEDIRPFLLYLYIIPLCCWAFDVITTLYAIDYLGVAEEMNPMGWPFGVWGALIFYIPTVLSTYFLLFRIENGYSFWVALLITVLALVLGAMNLWAGIHNIAVVSL